MKKFKVYYVDGANPMAKLGEFETILQAHDFIKSEINGRTLVDVCSEYLYSTAQIACYEMYNGNPVDEDGELQDAIYCSPYFYADNDFYNN